MPRIFRKSEKEQQSRKGLTRIQHQQMDILRKGSDTTQAS